MTISTEPIKLNSGKISQMETVKIPTQRIQPLDSVEKVKKVDSVQRRLFSQREKEEQDKSAYEEMILKKVEQLNAQLDLKEIKVTYSQHEVTGKYYATLVDGKTDEVIKEIPDKKLLDYAAGMEELLGMLFDETI